MRPILLMLLLGVGVAAQSIKDGDSATDWKMVGDTPNVKVYYSPSSIRRSGNIINVWLRADMPNGSEAAGLTRGVHPELYSGRVLAVIECEQSRVSTAKLDVRYYDREGKLARRRKENDSIKSEAWAPLLDQFCEVGSGSAPLAAPILKPQVRSSSSPADTAPKSGAASAATEKTEHPAHKP